MVEESGSTERMFKIGIDVGGTFTDFVLADKSGKTKVWKTLSTPADPVGSVVSGLEEMAREQGMSLAAFLKRVTVIVHGSTTTTNACLTGSGAKTGLITTKGFRDLLNMRRGVKEEQYNSKLTPPSPLVPRRLILAVDERVDRWGKITSDLNESEVRGAAKKFREEGIEAVAVSFLWSFLNPANEVRAKEVLEEELPGTYVCVSSDVLPQIRAYERHSTTVLNAYVGPPFKRYLTHLEKILKEHGYQGLLLIMQSNGGVMAPELAVKLAANTLLSGPAAGPVAGVFYGGMSGQISNIITVDMGGTSFDVSLVRDGVLTITTEGSVAGYSLAFPMVDIHTIGAGGGSVAWVDEGGILRVGPGSAGAEPGPACYGRSGSEPTVTDADLLLGYLSADFFWGGRLKLDLRRAEEVIKKKVADKLKISVTEAASGIFRVVNSNMTEAVRIVSIKRGYDPREFGLVVAGGAGPVHAGAIAQELEVPLIVVPRDSSVFCAVGMLMSDFKHDFVRTCPMEVARFDFAKVNSMFDKMRDEALKTLREEGLVESRCLLSLSSDLRYVGQFHEVEVPVDDGGPIDSLRLAQILNRFHSMHESMYGFSLPEAPVEFINVRVSARGVTDKPSLERMAFAGEDSRAALKGERQAFFNGAFKGTPVYDGLKLTFGNSVPGPAIVEQPTTTIVVPHDRELVCDEYGNYLIYFKGADIVELRRGLGNVI